MFYHVTDFGYIRLIDSKCSILILHLYHNDIPSFTNLKISQLFAHFVQKEFHTFHVVWVLLAKFDSAIDLSGLHILLAEDNELNMEIATEILTMNGITVTPAVNGAEALRLFDAASPYTFDAILMDMQMPEMDGCQATQAIRHLDRPDAADVPIIAVTANAFAEDIAKTTDAGMNGHISKPIDFQALCQTLQELIRPHHKG